MTLPSAALGAHVLAIEALPSNFALLSAAVHANRQWGKVTPVLMAAGREMGVVLVAGASAWGAIDRKQTKGVPVPTDTLANILKLYAFTDADLLKIDIEGAEMDALIGIEEILNTNPGMDIVIESNTHTAALWDYAVQDLWSRLIGLGFSLYSSINGGLVSTKANDPQLQTVVDVLATRQPIPDEYRIITLSDEDYWLSFEKLVATRHPHHCRHVLRQEPFLSERMRGADRWKRIAEKAGASA